MGRSIVFVGLGWMIGLVVCAYIAIGGAPAALAQTVIDTDCSTLLDQSDTTYRLIANTASDCTIAADNIILDGQGLYEINGNITPSGPDPVHLTVRNMPLVTGLAGSAGHLTLQNSTVTGVVVSFMGDLAISDSTVGAAAAGVMGGPDADLVISDSTVTGTESAPTPGLAIVSYTGSVQVVRTSVEGFISTKPPDSEYQGESVTLVDVSVNGYVHSAVNVSISGSEVTEEVFADADISITDSTIDGEVDGGGSVTITNAHITDAVVEGASVSVTTGSIIMKACSTAGDVHITDSTVLGAPAITLQLPTDGGSYSGLDGESALCASGGGITVTNSIIDGFILTTDPGYTIDLELAVVYGNVVADGTSVPDGTVTMTDSEIIGGEVFASDFVLTDTSPSITLTPDEVQLRSNESFNPFSGVDAEDTKDGDISDDVVVIGSVGAEEGVYELLYTVTDGGTVVVWNNATTTAGPSTATTTRIVTREGSSSSGQTSTRVGTRGDRDSKDEGSTGALATSDIDATLNELRVVLAQPVTTTDLDTLEKLLSVLLELVNAIVQLLALQK